jgi:hypothetical protein
VATREFTVEQLEELGLPYEGYEYEELEHGGGRWYDYMQVVFKAPDDGQYYQFYYQVGKTESQDCYWDENFDNGVVQAKRVHRVTRTVEVLEWEEI